MKLDSSNILLIAPDFYNYDTELVSAMTRLGANVTYISEMDQSVSYRLLQKVSNKLKRYLEKKHIDKIICESKKQNFTAVLIVRGSYFTPDIMKQLRSNMQDAKFFMYQWDSYTQNDYRDIIPFFDLVSTFDKDDAEELKLHYQPLFYTDIYKNVSTSSTDNLYDLVFYGAYHSDRLEIIKYIDSLFKKHDLIFKSHLYIKKIPLLYRLLIGDISFKDLKFFKTYSVSSCVISKDYASAKAVLDVELTIQSGLSIRTFEVLGSGVKLITTNKNIRNEEFYDCNQIMVIERNSIEIDLSFFSANENKIDVSNYHIDSWVQRLFSLK